MGTKEKPKMDDLKLTIIVALLYIVLAIVIAVVFICLYGGCLRPSDISSFIGSYAGGALGGFGALLAVFLTICHSLKVQAENSKEANDRMAEQNNINRTENVRDRDARREEQALEARRNLTNDIAEQIGKYITHISKYYFAVAADEMLDDAVKTARATVARKRKEYDNIINEQKEANSGKMKRPIKEIELDKERISKELAAAEKDFEWRLNERKDNNFFGNRLEANEAYSIILTKLIGISEAEDLTAFLEQFHRDVVIPERSDKAWIEEQGNSLMTKFGEFREAFV